MTTLQQTNAATPADGLLLVGATGQGNEVRTDQAPSRHSFDQIHNSFAEFHEGYVRHYISLADTKAAWTFAIASGVLSYVLTLDEARAILFNVTWAADCVLGSTSVVLLALSGACSFLVIAPRLTSPSGEGLVYFGDVARRPNAAAYLEDVAKHNEHMITEARLEHCYDTSKICSRKYDYLRKAIWLGAPGLIAALLFIAFL